MRDDPTFFDDIEGYCGRLSYTAGDLVELHVSSKHRRYHIHVARQGLHDDVVYEADVENGEFHEVPEGADANGCGWPVSRGIDVVDGWRSGFYLVTLTAPEAPVGHNIAHAGFVVRAPHSDQATKRSRPLLVLATNTWNAYNNWGGQSLYTGGHTVSFRRPFGRGMLHRPEVERDDRKARPTRWGEDADVDGEQFQAYRLSNGYPPAIGSSGWFTYERRFVEWAESEGYELDYAISSDLEDVEGVLEGRPLVLSVGHDEYWSAPQRNTLEDFIAAGGNLASFSGNTMFWQVRLEPAETGGTTTVDRGTTTVYRGSMVCYKYAAHEHDPVLAAGQPELMSGMWADPVVGKPETAVLGGGSAYGLYHRFGKALARGSGAFTVYRDDHWLVEGTGLRYGDLLGARDGVVGYETLGCRIQFDEFQLPIRAGGDGSPVDLDIVAFVPSSNLAVGEYPASISALNDQGDLEFIASRLYETGPSGEPTEVAKAKVKHGNAVMLVCWPYGRDKGEVVTIGTTDWAFGLAEDEAVSQVTQNVFTHFGIEKTVSTTQP